MWFREILDPRHAVTFVLAHRRSRQSDPSALISPQAAEGVAVPDNDGYFR
jgi:hypothetical protein